MLPERLTGWGGFDDAGAVVALHPLLETIVSTDPAVRHRSLDELVAGEDLAGLIEATRILDEFRRSEQNLYARVRALFFLYAIHRFEVPRRWRGGQTGSGKGLVPFDGYGHLLSRRFEEAIETFLEVQEREGASEGISSALATAYHRLAFQTLADQVRRSVRSVRGNQWMFRMGHPHDQPLRIRQELLVPGPDRTYPILRELTPVRMDLTHCGWSDIFFLGMDYPEAARVLNVSIDIGVHGRDTAPAPPVSAWLRVLDEPVLRLTSVDLAASADITALGDVFDFAKDYLGLLKAALIASGLVPPGIEGADPSLAELLARLVGPGKGLELVSYVNNIPKGSRLAVSTNLLGALISVCMRATGQSASLTGGLTEAERRLVLARALLGEWLGGSGGGWQDSGGIWPGIKLISGVEAAEEDPEWGISRGRLMPTHHVYDRNEVPEASRQALQDSLVLVHGGMAQNVGPILEMVTEKYLLRSGQEWRARGTMLEILDTILDALRKGDLRRLGEATTRNFRGPIQDIIPWATNQFTEQLIQKAEARFGEDYWGFWMLGGMSGGGMGFIFAPNRKNEAQDWMQSMMLETKREWEAALPFAMDPVVFDYAINETGTMAGLLSGDDALMPPGYYALTVPGLLKQERRSLSEARRAELDKLGAAANSRSELRNLVQVLFKALLPQGKVETGAASSLGQRLQENGFDRAHHEQIRSDLRAGRIGLAQNRLRTDALLDDVVAGDVTDLEFSSSDLDAEDSARTSVWREVGEAALRAGEVAVITLAAGAGSRWTQGAGVCKALHPFARLDGRHRTFLEVHLAKSRKVSAAYGVSIPHVFSTSYLTHGPTAEFLERQKWYGYPGPLWLSQGRSVGLRMVPMERDLRFLWEEMPQQVLDQQQQKVRDSLRHALIQWARETGEGNDYTDNLSLQCMHPVGHFYEVPNLFRNGVLAEMLKERPNLKYLLLHNIDTLGATVDPTLLGWHATGGSTLGFEVITRRIEDRGGGLARVNGRVRLVEGLTMPRESDEFGLRYYNSMTTWISIDPLLEAFELTRADLIMAASGDAVTSVQASEKITAAIRRVASRLPTYVTLKDVKKRWGHGQEDVMPVAQFEKLWSDLTALPEVKSSFGVVSRLRGQQLKDQAQLDGWLRDRSAAYIESLCDWG